MSRPPPAHSSRVERLRSVTESLRAKAVAPATAARYDSHFEDFCRFCGDIGADFRLPDPHVVDLFIGHLVSERGLGAAAVRRALSGLKFNFDKHNIVDPTLHPQAARKVARTLRGLELAAPTSKNSKLPITPEIFRQMRQAYDGSGFSKQQLATFDAISNLALFCGLRLGELLGSGSAAARARAPPTVGDLTRFDAADGQPAYFQLFLRRSKTDQAGLGSYVRLADIGSVGGLSPFAAVDSWLQLRLEGRRVDQVAKEPLFLCHRAGSSAPTPLSIEYFRAMLQQLLSRAGFPASSYSGHSFRKGCASLLAAAQVPDSVIKAIGRWKSDSFLDYIVTPLSQVIYVQTVLAESSATFDLRYRPGPRLQPTEDEP